MPLREAFGLEADLELFRSIGLRTRRHRQRAAHWEFGFGPVGGTHPIWGLYRFEDAACVVNQRELLWRACPTRLELLRWCTRIIDVELATRLLDAVGPIDIFYERYFGARPT